VKVTARREFLGGMAAFGALGASGCAGLMSGSGSARLPERGEVLIRNAYVMTMDSSVGDLPDADVHVRQGAIVAVGRNIQAGGAQVIEGRGMIVLPGFVETHWHMWNTLLRSMSGDKREHGYFPTAAALGKIYLPEDMYQGTRLSAAEALNGGITFVHDWCHNIRGPEFADANLRALKEAGIRGRFSYGAPQAHPAGETIDLADLERKQWTGGVIRMKAFCRSARLARRVQRPEVHGSERCGPKGIRRRAQARPADLDPREQRARPRGPDRGARERNPARPRRAVHPRDLGHPGGNPRPRFRRHAGELFRPTRNCASASAFRRRANSSRPASRSGCRWTRRHFPGTPTCSRS